MESSSLRKLVLKELDGRLWHMTHPDRFKRILESGAILPSSEAGNPDGWRTISGDPYRPFAHTLGAVSLFDFDQFDPESYTTKYPTSNWFEFVPYREKWGSAAWIEIDRSLIASHFISGVDLVERWKSAKAYEHNFMPYIEAAHLGPLPRAAFKRAFLISKGESKVRPVDV